MKITTDVSLRDFRAWSGGADTQQKILDEHKESEFESMVEELNPDGMTDTELNDFLWFEEEFIYEHLGIVEESEDEQPEE
jgi:hypothetical protein